MPSSHATAPGEVLLISGGKATLYDTIAGKEKWRSDLGTAPPTATAAPTPPPISRLKNANDPMRQIAEARIARRSAKLDQRLAQLNAKRSSLNTPLKVASFREEEAKYQAELEDLRSAKLTLEHSSGSDGAGGYKGLPDRRMEFDENAFGHDRREVFRSGSTIVVIQDRRVRLLDPANGRLTKEIVLAGDFLQAMQVRDCVYVLTAGDFGAHQLSRIGTGNGAVNTLDLTGVNADSRSSWAMTASSDGPAVEPRRTVFSAGRAELLQLDVRLVEKKITERQAMKTDSAADWEAADKNTSGGWSNDAAVYAKAIANDAQREVTSGRELVDESTYEVVLRRPFDARISETPPIKVQGRPTVFSTASFDLVTAGRSLIAFDHSNKKLWETKLACPIAAPSFINDYEASGPGTLSQPCLEDDKRLYFFDQGFLNAFDRGTGKTLWRLPSVGIHKVQLDSGGLFDSGPVLYVSSANRSAETLQYSQQAAATTLPLLFKLDPSTGKVLWKVEKYEDCFVSGGNVYVTHESRNAEDMVNSVFQRSKAIATRFKLYKLSARDGRPQWEWFQPRRPLRIEADKKKVSLLFADELQVLTSRAL